MWYDWRGLVQLLVFLNMVDLPLEVEEGDCTVIHWLLTSLLCLISQLLLFVCANLFAFHADLQSSGKQWM